MCPHFHGHVIIKAVQPSTLPRQIKRWIKRIKNTQLLQINNAPISSPEQPQSIFANILKKDKTFITRVLQDQYNPIQHDNGLPMLYFD